MLDLQDLASTDVSSQMRKTLIELSTLNSQLGSDIIAFLYAKSSKTDLSITVIDCNNYKS